MSHVLYVLLANGILKNVKMDALFFPSERHLPIDYTTLANHGMSEYYLNSIHRKELLKLDESQDVQLTFHHLHVSPKPLLVKILPHDLLLFEVNSLELIMGRIHWYAQFL